MRRKEILELLEEEVLQEEQNLIKKIGKNKYWKIIR